MLVVTFAPKRPSQAYYYYCTKKGSRASDNGDTSKAGKMKELYTTLKILLAGLQIISTAGFNLGVDFPPMVPSKDPGQITHQQMDLMSCTNESTIKSTENRTHQHYTKYGF